MTRDVEALEAAIRIPERLKHLRRDFAVSISGHNYGRWEAVPSAKMLEIWMEEAGFDHRRLTAKVRESPTTAARRREAAVTFVDNVGPGISSCLHATPWSPDPRRLIPLHPLFLEDSACTQ